VSAPVVRFFPHLGNLSGSGSKFRSPESARSETWRRAHSRSKPFAVLRYGSRFLQFLVCQFQSSAADWLSSCYSVIWTLNLEFLQGKYSATGGAPVAIPISRITNG